MASKKVWVEVGPTGLAIEIFRNKKMAALRAITHQGLGPEPVIVEMEYAQAVGEIRRQVFERDDYTCVKCGCFVVWERHKPNSGELDERQARGKCEKGDDGAYHSGAVSVANCQTLCKKCHTGPGGKQDRSPSFTKTPGLSPVQVLNKEIQVASAALDFAEQYRRHREE